MTQRERALILVKAFPQPSQKYEETVCCAGLTPEGQFVRLYPIRYRHLPERQRFDRWDLIEYEATRAPGDGRPESRHVSEDTIRIVQGRDHMPPDQRVRIWAPHVSPSLVALREANLADARSLGIVRPDAGSLRFKYTKLSPEAARAKQAEFRQVSLLESETLPELPVEYEFRYQFTCAGTSHDMKLHDWEVQAKERVERLLIREGTAKPSIDHYTSFYVVNQGKQQVTLRDYGFLLYSGKLMSIPYRSENAGPGDDIDLYEFKSLVLEPLAHVQTGMDVPGRVAGFYVQSTTAKRPIIRFAYDLPLSNRLVLAFKRMGRLEYA